MKYHTTIYRLTKDGDVRTFASEKDACNFLGIGKCNVSSAYRRGYKCKGWNIEKGRKLISWRFTGKTF